MDDKLEQYPHVKRFLKSVPTRILLREAAERKREAKAKGGPWAVLRRFSKCPYCRRKVGVRQKIQHRYMHRHGKPCPTGSESYPK